MKGLLMKDIYLLKNMKNTCALFFLIAIILLVSGQEVGFVLGYTVVTSISLVFNIHALDTAENGEAFLMTLPVERKYYAIEKFVISYLCMIVINAIISAIIFVTAVIQDKIELKELLVIDFGIICMVSIIVSIMLPVNIKFGVEKGRILMVILFAGLMGVLLLMEDAISHAEKLVVDILKQLDKNPAPIFGMFAIICVIANLISILCTIRIVEKKEF